jgi:hypothetical protein
MAGLRVTVVKPVKPLRYRLSPVEEKLDNLDKLEKEFEATVKAGKVPEEQEIESRLYIKVQREKLQAQKDKALGIIQTVEKELIDRTGDKLPTQWEQYLTHIDPQKAFKCCLCIAVMVWFYCKNS